MRCLLSWIEEKLNSRCYDLQIIQWVDKEKKIFKYIKKRTKHTNEKNLILFIDWAKVGNRYNSKRKNSEYKPNFRKALKNREKAGFVKELDEKNEKWYIFQILGKSEKKRTSFKNNVNVSKQKKIEGLKKVDQQTQTSISKICKTRGKKQCTGKQQSKSMEPVIEKNIPIQNGEVSSSTEPLSPCQSLLNNFPCTTNSQIPSEQMEMFTNLDLNQNFHGICTEYFQASNSEFFHEVPSVHNLQLFANNLVEPALSDINANNLFVEPDLSEWEESLFGAKFGKNFSTQSEQKQLGDPLQILELSLSSLVNLAEIEQERTLVPSVVQSDCGYIWHDSFVEYDINSIIENQDISVLNN